MSVQTGTRRLVEMGAILSTPPTGSKRSEYGAWIPTAQTRSGSPTRHSPTVHNVRRTASGWSICGALPGPPCVYPSRERSRRRRLHRTWSLPVLRRCRWAAIPYSVAISPDGKRIAYLTLPNSPVESGSPSASRPNQLKVIPFDGGVPLYQFDWPPSASDPRWAPGGDAVEYVLTRNGVSNIWQQKLTGGPPKQITNFESGLIFDFEWSPDGGQLALTRGTLTQ